MKVTREMSINDVLMIDERKMLKTLTWLVPELERLQYPHPKRAVVGAVTIEQAARIAHIPLVEMLYALNLAAGESEEDLAMELKAKPPLAKIRVAAAD
jgi:hypothetical protein